MQNSRPGVGPTPQQRLIELALSYVGKTEATKTRSPEIDLLKKSLRGVTDDLPYCVDAIRALAKAVDLELGTKNVLFDTRSARSLWNLTPKEHRSAFPVPGCCVVWGFYDKIGQPLVSGHVGLFIARGPADFRMQTFEANTSPQPTGDNREREGDGFWLRDRGVKPQTGGPMRLLGFLKIWP